MQTFEIGDKKFAVQPASAIDQFHILRRFGPIIASAQKSGSNDIFTSIATAIRDISDEDCNYIIYKCLSFVRVNAGGVWANLVDKNTLLHDLTLQEIVMIIQYVVTPFAAPFLSAFQKQNPE